ncbi:glycosyltransferase [Nakamurella alba]|uniref:glycosyltransferase n=1 Tax=Nakamurella alba TaxID=2665158 RepID=UPI0018A903EA|nr:glycosyltransferase [Nakamurella alba]
MTSPVLSVVVPAHNEEAVITRLLSGLLDGISSGELEVVVAANGCTDGTVAAARAVHPAVRVAETTTASKIAALNLGDDVATVFPRAYVDADIAVDTAALREIAAMLTDPEQPLVGAPAMVVDASRSSWPVRAHYRIWELTDYRSLGHVGSGIYALSEAGRGRFGQFPDVIADDRYVQELFTLDERRGGTRTFTVHAPRTFRALVHRSVRSSAGNAQLRSRSGADGRTDSVATAPGGSGMKNLVKRVARRPLLWPDFAVYCVGYVVPRILGRRKLARGQAQVWERDETSRT